MSTVSTPHPPARWRLLPTVTAGLATGLLEVAVAISFAALLFAGPLASYLPQGVGLALMGTMLTGAVISLLSTLPGMIGGNQDLPVAVAAVMVTAIATAMPPGATSEETFLTVVAAISVSTLLAGGVFLSFGYFRLGRLVRFLPYPVVGGFLASTGWLLASGALSLMVEPPALLRDLPDMLAPPALWRWLPGVVLAVLLLVLVRRYDHFLILPLTLLGAVLLFYLLAWATGLTPAALSAGGWLLGPFAEQGLWRPWQPADFSAVHWPVVARQAGHMATIALVSLVGLLLVTGGIELEARRDLDLNRELRAAGLANLLAGLAGGLVGFQALSSTALNLRLRSANRLTGLIVVALCGLALLVGGALLSYAPKLVLAALLLFLGLTFLMEWVVDAWTRMPRTDYAIVLAILLVTIASSFLIAVTLGLLLATVLFVVGYSRIDVVRDELTAATYRSRVTRPRAEAQYLQQEGQRLSIFRLQGYIFFGTADALLDRVRQRLEGVDAHPVAIILDFRRVIGLDATAVRRFRRMRQLSRASQVALVLTACAPRIRRQLAQGNLGEDSLLRYFPNLDQGMSWAEARLLEPATPNGDDRPATLEAQLGSILEKKYNLHALLNECDRLEVSAGQLVMAQGDPGDVLFFVESGQVTAQLNRPGQPPVRLQTMGGGHVIGELGFYLNQPRTADVIADEPAVLYRLSRDQLQRLEREDPQAAAALHHLVAYLLAERVTQLTVVIDSLDR